MVAVTKSETQSLITLLHALPRPTSDSPPVEYVSATLAKMLTYFKSDADTNKLTLPNEFYTLMRLAVEQPLVPADCHRMGIELSAIHTVLKDQVALRKKFMEPELVDPNFVGFTQQPDRRFLN